MAQPVQITLPSEEPITLAEALNQCRLDPGVDDARVSGLVVAARRWAEDWTGRAFVDQRFLLSLDCWPRGGVILLPRGRVSAVASVKYVDGNGTLKTLVENTDYVVDLDSTPARISPAYNVCWPYARHEMNAIRVEYTAGFGSASDVPDDIKAALLLHVEQSFDRKDYQAAIEGLLRPHRVYA